MKRTKHIEFEPEEVPEILFNVTQALNEFQVQGLIRKHALKRFKGLQHTKEEWRNLFQEERIL
jgi:hypothetical protein